MLNNEHGCFITYHENKIETVFYIRPDLWLKVMSLTRQITDEIKKNYAELSTNDFYMLKHSSEDMITPMPKSILQGMISEGTSINNIDIAEFVAKCNNKDITIEFVTNVVNLLRHEVEKTEKILQNVELINKINVDNLSSCSDDDIVDFNTDSE